MPIQTPAERFRTKLREGVQLLQGLKEGDLDRAISFLQAIHEQKKGKRQQRAKAHAARKVGNE